MKLVQKSSIYMNDQQRIVVKAGLLQLLLGLIMIMMLMRCTNRENQLPKAKEPNIVLDTNQTNGQLKDSMYVPIAGYLSNEVKSSLKDLETKNFSKGAIADQVLDYLKKGDNDFGVEFKFIELRFEKRTATFSEKFAQEIIDLATLMNKFPNMKIKLMSYTDNIGDEKTNDKLSEDRALAIRKRMMEHGVHADRVIIKAFGEKYPVGDNKTYNGQMINNRIEMMILSK